MERFGSGTGGPSEAAREIARTHGWAWVALSLALAVHVTDEALTGFLSVYNPAAAAIRRYVPFLPLPVFTFRVWLAGLIVAAILLLVLSSFAFRGARWTRLLSYPFAVLMLFNGLGHLIGSFYLRQPMPGVYSAPLLLAGSVWLILTARQNRQAGMPVLH